MSKNDEWLQDRVTYIGGLKSPTQKQTMLVALFTQSDRTPAEQKKLDALVKAEKAKVNARRAEQKAAALLRAEQKAEKEAERKARNRAIFETFGLLVLAGVVDSKTGKPKQQNDEFLGALMGLARIPDNDPRREEWKRAGQLKLQEEKNEN